MNSILGIYVKDVSPKNHKLIPPQQSTYLRKRVLTARTVFTKALPINKYRIHAHAHPPTQLKSKRRHPCLLSSSSHATLLGASSSATRNAIPITAANFQTHLPPRGYARARAHALLPVRTVGAARDDGGAFCTRTDTGDAAYIVPKPVTSVFCKRQDQRWDYPMSE